MSNIFRMYHSALSTNAGITLRRSSLYKVGRPLEKVFTKALLQLNIFDVIISTYVTAQKLRKKVLGDIQKLRNHILGPESPAVKYTVGNPIHVSTAVCLRSAFILYILYNYNYIMAIVAT